MRKIIESLNYYFHTTYRRKMIDDALGRYSKYFSGKILDVGGGRVRGMFKKKNEKWVTVDIEKKFNPDVVASVEKLPFKNESFNSIKATELFEHVDNFEKGLSECTRVLKKGGLLIISSPFLYPLHPDPFDFQRLSLQKWSNLAKKNGLKILKIEEQGYFFTILGEMIRGLIREMNILPLRYLLYLTFPIIDGLTLFDKVNIVKNSHLKKFIEGYFIVAKK
ncbi:hypothetical protein A2164_00995 [Candidatus Curtissbacteria bacterium RBG_13_35_7]|uniref:Methyltransferase type 11 domain-containing protein n=1 Tax=Candidatus Curtissbacteria bacterium RBG_13_35_7 TaxID=1797705 RepID=A0A1F5G4W4_9BACT|nr:MAG: hypothetical protein A2164_00995 [Candidatus Curtissbacteria bacterium RBG_13_35_7]